MVLKLFSNLTFKKDMNFIIRQDEISQVAGSFTGFDP